MVLGKCTPKEGTTKWLEVEIEPRNFQGGE
jgi:hypothetical protein